MRLFFKFILVLLIAPLLLADAMTPTYRLIEHTASDAPMIFRTNKGGTKNDILTLKTDTAFIGVNDTNPTNLITAKNATGNAGLELHSGTATSDTYLKFVENSIAKYHLGFDGSAASFVLTGASGLIGTDDIWRVTGTSDFLMTHATVRVKRPSDTSAGYISFLPASGGTLGLIGASSNTGTGLATADTANRLTIRGENGISFAHSTTKVGQITTGGIDAGIGGAGVQDALFTLNSGAAATSSSILYLNHNGSNALSISHRAGTGSIIRNHTAEAIEFRNSANAGTLVVADSGVAQVKVDAAGACGIGNICSGTYTPVLTSISPAFTASGTHYGKWFRVGNIVDVTVNLSIHFSNSTTFFYISTPVTPANFTLASDLGGVCTPENSGGRAANIAETVGSPTLARTNVTGASTTSQVWFICNFKYRL